MLSLIGEMSGSTYDWWLSGNDLFEEDNWTFLSGIPVPSSVFYSVYNGSPRPVGSAYNCLLLNSQLGFAGHPMRCSQSFSTICQYFPQAE